MRRFSITSPSEYEDKIIEELGRLGVAQLIKESVSGEAKKTGNLEICERYTSLRQKLDAISSVFQQVHKESPKKRRFNLRGITQRKIQKNLTVSSTIFDLVEIDKKTNEIGPTADAIIAEVAHLQEEVSDLKVRETRLTMLEKNGMKIDEVGDFRHIFVKVGLLKREFHHNFERHMKSLSLAYSINPSTHTEDFIVISGSMSYKFYVEEILKLLNFDEFIFNGSKDSNFKSLTVVRSLLKEAVSNLMALEDRYDKVLKELKPFEDSISEALKVEDARSAITKVGKQILIQGWVPADELEDVRGVVENSTNGTSNFSFESPTKEDTVPTKLPNRGVFRFFELFVKLAGTPNYFEIDPTPIFTILYVTMFGMMFGDIGGGIAFAILGLLLSRVRKNLLGLPRSAVRKLGIVILFCGMSAIVFGALYGEFFLFEVFNPLLLSPIHDQNEMITIALTFGVAQIALALVLNIINKFRMGHKLEAILSEKGLLGLAYYSVGVLLAIKFVQGNMSLNAFVENMLLTYTALGLLGLIFLAPVVIGFIEGKGGIIEKLLLGFTHFFEAFISFLTNSVSYIRLAAFALSHGAFALCAAILAGIIGGIPSYILINVLVFIIEGMSVGIQAMRLMYYEFFTKFYTGDGKPYRPFQLKANKKDIRFKKPFSSNR